MTELNPHAKGDGWDWRESYYCNFFDAKRAIRN